MIYVACAIFAAWVVQLVWFTRQYNRAMKALKNIPVSQVSAPPVKAEEPKSRVGVTNPLLARIEQESKRGGGKDE